MQIEKINNSSPNSRLISKTVKILKSDGIIVIPTETAYGLACDATNEKAVKKIYKIKGRSFKKFLPLICGDISQVKNFFRLNRQELGLFKKYKGLSIIVGAHCNAPVRGKFNQIYLLKNQKDCAVRISTNKICKLLANKLGKPITATSANIAGEPSCYSVEDILKQFGSAPKGAENFIDLVLDAGGLDEKKPSTIVKVEGDRIKILRQGEIKI